MRFSLTLNNNPRRSIKTISFILDNLRICDNILYEFDDLKIYGKIMEI